MEHTTPKKCTIVTAAACPAPASAPLATALAATAAIEASKISRQHPALPALVAPPHDSNRFVNGINNSQQVQQGFTVHNPHPAVSNISPHDLTMFPQLQQCYHGLQPFRPWLQPYAPTGFNHFPIHTSTVFQRLSIILPLRQFPQSFKTIFLPLQQSLRRYSRSHSFNTTSPLQHLQIYHHHHFDQISPPILAQIHHSSQPIFRSIRTLPPLASRKKKRTPLPPKSHHSIETNLLVFTFSNHCTPTLLPRTSTRQPIKSNQPNDLQTSVY